MLADAFIASAVEIGNPPIPISNDRDGAGNRR